MSGKDKWRRLSPNDADRLRKLIVGQRIQTSSGKSGVVENVTEAGITVKFQGGSTQYPLCGALEGGLLTLTKTSLHEQALFIISANKADARSSTGAKSEAKPKTDPIRTHASKSVSDVVEADGTPKELSLSNNVMLACLLSGYDCERLRRHLAGLGFAGFDESLSKGFEGEHMLLALRETSIRLGCGYGPLMLTIYELVEHVLEACSSDERWVWDARRVDSARDSRRCESTVHCAIKGGWCEVIFTVLWRHGVLSEASAIRVDVLGLAVGGTSRHIRVAMPNPGDDVVKRLLSHSQTHLQEKIPTSPKDKPAKEARGERKPSGKGTKKTAPSLCPIHVNEFLVRKSYGQHRTGGHSLIPIRFVVCVLPKFSGGPKPVEFDAFWCPKCKKYFMKEGTYIGLKQQGFICCRVVEEKDLGTKKTEGGLYGHLASESILHSYGYNVNQQSDLSNRERQAIVSFVIENEIQSAQDVAHLLEWLIRGRRNDPRMQVAVARWRSDLDFVTHYHKPTRLVRVDGIFAKV